MNEIVAVIAALVGSSGVASILAGGTQFRRTHKLQLQIKELDASKKLFADQPRERTALEAAAATVALDLAAHILIKSDTRRLVLLGFVGSSASGFAMIAFGYMPSRSADFLLFPLPVRSSVNIPLITAGFGVLFAGYIASFIYLYLRLSRRRRERFIARVLQEPHVYDSSAMLLAARTITDPIGSANTPKEAGVGANATPPRACGP